MNKNQLEEHLFSVCAEMRALLDQSYREGIEETALAPAESCQLVDIHVRLQHRIRAMEVALREFRADLARIDRVFNDAEKRAKDPRLLFGEPALPLEAAAPEET